MLRNRIKGCAYGAAAGDALGAAFEFMYSDQITAALGEPIAWEYCDGLPGSLMPRHPAGMPTDDTAMTLALVHALAEAEPTPASVAQHFVQHLEHGGTYGELFWNGGPGGACTTMLRHLHAGAAPFERISANAGGNGAAMRAHPCGVFRDRARVAELAAMQARLSHGEPSAVAAAQVVALSVHQALYDGTITLDFPSEVTDAKMRDAWNRMHRDLDRGSQLPPHLRDVDMAGWNTVAAAHAIAYLYRDDPERGIGMAAASGRDTDTVASITGAILGAANGFDALPARWIDGLKIREPLEAATDLLHQLACS